MTIPTTMQFWRAVLATSCLLSACTYADDVKENRLEQDVRELKRQVEQLSRRVEQLERSPPAAGNESAYPPNHLRAPPPDAPWYSLENWQRIQVGTKEEDARRILGPPTTVRDTKVPGEQQLFYARELKLDSFLSGYLKVKDHRVTEVQVPALR